MALNLNIPGPMAFLRYVYDIRYYIYIVILIFAVFLAAGYAVSVFSPGTTDMVKSSFEEQVEPMKDLTPLGLMWGIFFNNASKCFLVVLFGIAFGIAPALFIIANGFIIGIVVGFAMSQWGPLYVLIGIVPHGVIELPMVFISAAIGLKLGYETLMALVKGKKEVFGEIAKGLLMFIFYILPLLFIAAFIETFVTGALLMLLQG